MRKSYPPQIVWTSDMDATIRQMREQQKPWDEIADVVRVGRVTLVNHAKTVLKLPTKVQRRGYTHINRVYKTR